MKTKIDWNRAARNGIHATRNGASRFLIVSGRLTLLAGRLLCGLGKRLSPSPRPDKQAE
jgi:hypothetical protein